MLAIPALDLRDGACVQLVGGSYAKERIRLDDPIAVARQWANCGFRHLHVVDLDAATGAGDNSAIVNALLDDGDSEIRVGGGVRTRNRVDELLAAGAARVIVGTRAIEDLGWFADVAAAHPGLVIVAADVRERRIVTHGWSRALPLNVFDFLSDVEHLPIAGALVTAVHREGHMAGPDLALMQDLAESTSIPIIASGGIATHDDLRALEHRGVTAAVIGMALYTGVLDPELVAQEFSA
ncbi:MAG: 1-(5-phosphoribosyl)-5-[(5-phosphoribosylamino)methylideneamino] imidazole-4-carboxamide isomerase [Gemmatimonadaceae bacterium]